MGIRWLIRRDMDEVLAIERASFEHPWTEEEFLVVLRTKNCIGMVLEVGTSVKGFMLYELHQENLRILNFAVDPDERNKGYGTALVEKLVGKLSEQRRHEINLEVRETNVPAQLFFAGLGFKAIGILKGHYEDSHEDAYHMRYTLGEPQVSLTNRISKYFAEQDQ